MQKIVNGIVVEYSKQDEDLVKAIAEKLEEKSSKIMDFFKLKEIEDFKIKIWDNLDEFKKHFTMVTGDEYYDWINGHTGDRNINILPARLARLSNMHRDITNEQIAIDTCHEFVHICQQNACPEEIGSNFWFWEALATNLGNPEAFWWVIPKFDEVVHFDEIKDIETLKNAIMNAEYKYAYLVGNYMLKNIPHKQILDYVKDEHLMEKDAETVLKNTKNFYKNFSQKQNSNTESTK